MHGEAVPYWASVVETKVIGECLAAVNIQIVHYQVNDLRGGIASTALAIPVPSGPASLS